MAKRKDLSILAKINGISVEETELLNLAPGTRLGIDNRYEIVNFIGNGSIGAVYLAKDYEKEEGLVVLKLILPYLFDNEKKIESFSEKINLLRAFQQTNIVELLDIWQQERLYFFVTEYVEGISFGDWITEYQKRGENISVADTVHVLRQICSGLSVLHNICGHYLLHPENILLTKEATTEHYLVKISDCIMYMLQSPTFWQNAAEIMQVEAYRAPELKGVAEPKLFKENDLYSVGVLLHQMLYQKLPGSKVNLRSDTPAQLHILMEQFLEKNLHRRISLKKAIPLINNISFVLGETKIKETKKVDSPAKKEANLPVKKEGTEHQISIQTKVSAEPKLDDIQPSGTVENNVLQYSSGANTQEANQIGEPTGVEQHATKQDIADMQTSLNSVYEEELYSPEYAQKLNECKQILAEKQYRQAIPVLEHLLSMQETKVVKTLLQDSKMKITSAHRLKNQAQECSDPRAAIKILEQSLDIYPYDPEVQNFYEFLKGVAEKLDMLEKKSRAVLEQGDHLVENGKYEEAIATWKNMLGLTDREEEFRDRIMQTLDIICEQAQTLLDEDKPYEAKIWVQKALKHSNEEYIKELLRQVEKKITDFHNRFLSGYQEGEKLLESKRYMAAISIWESILSLRPDQTNALKAKIEQARELQNTLQQQEQEYLQLLNKVRTFEKQEKYEEALAFYEKLEIDRENWICPIQDPTPEIERLKKLCATMRYSSQIQTMLVQVHACIDKKKWGEAEEIFSSPLLSNIKLSPSLQMRIKHTYDTLIERKKHAQRVSVLYKSLFGLVVFGGILYGVWYFVTQM